MSEYADLIAAETEHLNSLEESSLEWKDDYNEVIKRPLEDFEYLLHHIHIDGGEEVIHHCRLYDHIGNMFVQGHLTIKDGMIRLNGRVIIKGEFHVLTGLEPTQEVCWSEEEAIEAEIKPKKMVDGMTRKEKAKIW